MGIFDDLLGNTSADASRAAAADTYQKQLAATQGLQKYGATLPGQYNQLATQFQPYQQAGGSALQQLLAGLGLGGPGGQQAFTNAYQALPGYQSGLQTGQQAVERGLNARGTVGGPAAKSLYRFGSDYENQRSGDYLNRLTGLQGQGLGATGQAVGTRQAGLGAQTGVQGQAAGLQYGAAPTVGQGDIAAAQAQQGALTNLLGLGGSILGSALGGPIGGAISGKLFGGGGGYYGGSPATNPLLRPYGT